MFKQLKDKIAEEVKSSPNRIQQIAQAAKAAVSSASGANSEVSGSDSFFSIAEDDTPQNSPAKKPAILKISSVTNNTGPNNGAIPRIRKLSNSSVASDASFRLPSYEPNAGYHLQSDLDVSASEVEDFSHSSSTITSQLDSISKQQLHDAYKKVLDRYQKYRSRYTELAKRYRDLERDTNKARTVLVETQEKALRKIGELREQCSLEQQAKAHLEAALRLEMDEMQYVIQTLQTKLNLLGDNAEKVVAPAQTENIKVTKSNQEPDNELNNTDEIKALNDKIQKLDQQLLEFQNQIQSLNEQLTTKQPQNDSAIADLQKTIDDLRAHIEDTNKQNYKLVGENKKLTEAITQSQSNQISLNQKIVDLNQMLNDSKATKVVLESINAKSGEHISNLEREKNSMMTHNVTLKTENADLQSEIVKINGNMQQTIAELVKDNQELADKNKQLQNISGNSQKQINVLEAYKAEIEKRLAQCVDELREMEKEKNSVEKENTQFKSAILDGQKAFNSRQQDINKVKERNDELFEQFMLDEREKKAMQLEISTLKDKIESVKTEKRDLTKTLDKEIRDKNELQNQVTNIIKEIGRLEEELTVIKHSYETLQVEKQSLEEKLEANIAESRQTRNESISDLPQPELKGRINELETNLLSLQTENSILLEKNNILLEAKSHLENILKKIESSFKKEKTQTQETIKQFEIENTSMKNELEFSRENSEKLNLKMTQILEEHSQLVNAKELMEHNFRSLQDNCDSKDKEKLCILDTNKCLEEKVCGLQSEIDILKQDLNVTNQEKEKLEGICSQLNDKMVESEQTQMEQLQTEAANSVTEKAAAEILIERLKSELESVKTSIKQFERERQEELAINEAHLTESTSKLSKAEHLLQESSQKSKSEAEMILQNCEKLKIENQNINKLVQSLESDLVKSTEAKQLLENEIKSLRESISTEATSRVSAEEANKTLQDVIENVRFELDAVSKMRDDLANEAKERDSAIASDRIASQNEVDSLTTELASIRDELDLSKSQNEQPTSNVSVLQIENDKLKAIELQLMRRLEELQISSEAKFTILTQEMEDVASDSEALKDRMSDFSALKAENDKLRLKNRELIQNQKDNESNNRNNSASDDESTLDTVARHEMETKLQKIMQEVQEVSNRNLFLEQKCENYLLIEHSNERLKTANEKLSRQLDETLVSVHHNNEGISANTEFEYLRNIMLQYLTGNMNNNNNTLVKVIAAVLKFSPQQTQVVVEKEVQRHTLLGQINKLL